MGCGMWAGTLWGAAVVVGVALALVGYVVAGRRRPARRAAARAPVSEERPVLWLHGPTGSVPGDDRLRR